MGFVDDVGQYGKTAAGHASGAGVGLYSYEQDEVRRKESPTMPARRIWMTGGLSACIAPGEKKIWPNAFEICRPFQGRIGWRPSPVRPE
ncbi:MAG: hypothetical protein ACR2M4_08065 [Actinomycetota bacterium]